MRIPNQGPLHNASDSLVLSSAFCPRWADCLCRLKSSSLLQIFGGLATAWVLGTVIEREYAR
jgi:hypothetical protein